MYAKFKFFRPLLLDFLSGSRIFLCKEFWVNVPVTMFFGMMVYIDCCALHSSMKYQLIPLPSVIALNILCQKSQHCAPNLMLSRAQFHIFEQGKGKNQTRPHRHHLQDNIAIYNVYIVHYVKATLFMKSVSILSLV